MNVTRINMKFFKYFPAKILLISFATQGIAQEEIVPPSMIPDEQTSLLSKPLPVSTVMTNKNIHLYGSLSFVPGGGISVRERRGSNGTALDYKIGVLSFVAIDSPILMPILSIDYNFLYFSKGSETSPYFSYGIGTAYFVPYVPLRAGIEFKHGFIDIGGKLVLGFIPSPEIRAGVGLKF